MLWLLTPCSGGSSRGGGSGQNVPATPTTPLTYNKADLKGRWRWFAKRQTNSDTLSGTISFDKEVRLTDIPPIVAPGVRWWMPYSGYGEMSLYKAAFKILMEILLLRLSLEFILNLIKNNCWDQGSS